MYNVKFLKGTLDAYNGLANKDPNTFYYADNDLFLGEIKLSNGADLTAAILRIAENETDIQAIQDELGALTGSESGQSINQMINTAVNAAKTELRTEIKANSDAIDAIEADYLKAADKAELAEDIKAISDDYLKAADKTELDGKIKANTDAIAVLNGDATVEGSVAKEVKDAINEFATATTDNQTYDTFAELVNYISNHGGEAAEMGAAIDALEEKVGEKSVATQISEAFTTANLDQYATDAELATLTETVNGKAAQSDLDTAEGKIEVLEGKVSTLEGKVDVTKVSEAIATAKGEATQHADDAIAALDATVNSADVEEGKGIKITVVETDGKLTSATVSGNYDNKYDAKGAAAQALTDSKSYTDTEIGKLSGVYDAKGAAATAEQNAKDYADGLAGNYDAAGSASTAEQNAKDYAAGLAGNYATAEQGTKADSALQKADITTGSANGTIAVKGTDVAVKGLGTAAYTASTAYDAAGTAETKANAALASAKTYAENEADTAEANAKAYTDTALTWRTIA